MWISVTDRLPEMIKYDNYYAESLPVMCVIGNDIYPTICILTQYEDEKPRWKTHDSEGWDVTYDVTHWAPCQELPKRTP
jgi:hypothetical protein